MTVAGDRLETTLKTTETPSTAQRTGQDRYVQMVDYLIGRPAPALPGVPGRVIRAYDEPLPDDLLPFITTPGELGLILGIGRHRANRLIQQRATTAHITERQQP